MNIADNILRAHLTNVFFVGGTACGGKTTIARALAQKHGFTLYDMDARFAQHQKIADCVHQPAMAQTFDSWEAYFCRPYWAYSAWLQQSVDEQLQMALIDLIELSREQPVIADLHLSLETARRITDRQHMVFLIASPQRVARDYYARPDHRDICDCIMGLPDPQKAFENCSKALIYTTQPFYDTVKRSEMFWLERDESSTVAGTLARVERHFALDGQHQTKG